MALGENMRFLREEHGYSLKDADFARFSIH